MVENRCPLMRSIYLMNWLRLLIERWPQKGATPPGRNLFENAYGDVHMQFLKKVVNRIKRKGKVGGRNDS